jgi:uncharacterized protein YrrD
MQKLYSDLIGSPVFDESAAAPVVTVRDVIIDPETGKILAFLVKKNRVIVPLDITWFNSNLYISSVDAIIPIDDVLRVKQVFDSKISILGSRVISSRNKKYLGRAVDFAIDTSHMILAQIIVAKIFLFVQFQERTFPQKNIIKIELGKIIVKDENEIKDSENVKVRQGAFAA